MSTISQKSVGLRSSASVPEGSNTEVKKTSLFPPIIAFLGTKRVGKDTCSDYLVEKYSFVKKTLAEPMKEALAVLFGFSEE